MNPSALRVLFLALLIQCVGIADHSLWTPDEPREAQIVREMSLARDPLIPRLSGRPFLEKPPLYYTVATGMYKSFGGYYDESGRLASLLFAFSTLLVVYFTTRKIYGDESSVFAPLILATFPLFFLASHKMLVDVGLVFFITAGMCAFLLAYKGLFGAGYKVFWLCLVLAFLTKGIIGLAIPGAGILFFMLWQRDAGFIRDAWAIQGTLLVLAVMLAWSLVLYLKGGTDFLYSFYVYNQIARFIPAGMIYQGGHVRPFYFYLLDVPVQTAPWSLLLIPALVSAGRPRDTEKFLYSWLLGGLLLLSIASTKREIYFLPMFPAMALIISRWMARSASRETRRWEDFILYGTIVLMLIAWIAIPVGYVKIGGGMLLAAGLTILTACIFALLRRHYRQNLALIAVIGWLMVFILWAPALVPQIDQSKSYKQIFTDIGREVSHREAIGYNLTETIEALGPFYGGFPVRNIEDRAQFIKALDDHESSYIIVLPKRLDPGLREELAARASLIDRRGGSTRREIELWKMHSYP